MTSMESVLQDKILGKLTTFDRMIFRGHLMRFFRKGAFAHFLAANGVLLKEFGGFVEKATAEVKSHAQALAAAAGRPFVYLESACTAATGHSKEDIAREIATRDGVCEGLVCVLYTLEPAWSFAVRGNRATHRLEVVRRRRKCLHFYFYLLDAELGFMHVRLQSWFPFQVQVYVNGREWLARRLDQEGIGYQRYDNALLQIDDLERAGILAAELASKRWPDVLDVFARRVNPWLPRIAQVGFGSYYWCLHQAEIATDVMFADRDTLQRLLPDLYDHAIRAFGAEDVLRFLGRKLHGNFQGEVTTDRKKRPEGIRVKHRVNRNSIKMYDKATILRLETTINNPRDFRVLKAVEAEDGTSRRWVPMGKGVANTWRYLQVGTQANARYLEALATVQLKGEAIEELDALCRSHTVANKRHARFQPVSVSDGQLFAAVMAGEHQATGFRNHDLTARLYPQPATCPEEKRRRCARTSRVIAKLRGHGLVAKVPRSRRYRVTRKGCRVMAAALRYRWVEFPNNYALAQ